MRTEPDFARFASLVFAVAILVALLLGSPLPLPVGWDKAAHFAALVLLFMKRKAVCAESSPP